MHKTNTLTDPLLPVQYDHVQKFWFMICMP